MLLGSLAFSTDGLGLTPGNPLSLIQASETPEEARLLSQWFDAQWSSWRPTPVPRPRLNGDCSRSPRHRDPFLVYTLILHHLFRDRGDELDEERIVKSATGIRNTVVWKKLFKFQRDGVVGAIDKLEPLRRLHHRRQRRPREDVRGARHHQVPRAAQRPRARALPQAPARQLDALQGQRPPQLPRARPLQLRRPEPHRPVARRRALRRHRPRPRQLGQLRPRRHRRVAQLPQQAHAADRAARPATTA